MKYPLNWLIKYKLPGDFLSLNRQCEIAYPNLWRTYYVQKTYKWYCKGYCFVPGHQFRAADHYWDFLFVDGTVCLNRTAYGHHSWICLNGECVPDKRGRDGDDVLIGVPTTFSLSKKRRRFTSLLGGVLVLTMSEAKMSARGVLSILPNYVDSSFLRLLNTALRVGLFVVG
ncbi:hypothetical protein MRX96_056351 [Rhipicephalus microplus]